MFVSVSRNAKQTTFVDHTKHTDLMISKLHIHFMSSKKQCCGSATFWYRSGSADSYHWLTDLDPAFLSVTDKMITINTFFSYGVLLISFRRYRTFTSVIKDYRPKRSRTNLYTNEHLSAFYIILQIFRTFFPDPDLFCVVDPDQQWFW